MSEDEWPSSPPLVSRLTSSFIIGFAGLVSRSFLCGANRIETIGLDAFCNLLDRRFDIANRERGLITGMWYTSDHVQDMAITVVISVKSLIGVCTYMSRLITTEGLQLTE